MIDLVVPEDAAVLLLAILQGSGFDVAPARASLAPCAPPATRVLRALGVHGEEVHRLRQVCERWAPGTDLLCAVA